MKINFIYLYIYKFFTYFFHIISRVILHNEILFFKNIFFHSLSHRNSKIECFSTSKLSVREMAWMAVQSSELHRFSRGKSVHGYVIQTSCGLRLVLTYVSFVPAYIVDRPRWQQTAKQLLDEFSWYRRR